MLTNVDNSVDKPVDNSISQCEKSPWLRLFESGKGALAKTDERGL